MNDEALKQAVGMLRSAKKAIVFSGAGVSTESGIPDFRGREGLWARYDPAEFATLSAFMRNPERVWGMLAELDGLMDSRPNAGHRALAELEADGALVGVITQNIDGLHQAAGSQNVVEFHGSGRSFTCLGCGRGFSRQEVEHMPRPGPHPMPIPADCSLDAKAGQSVEGQGVTEGMEYTGESDPGRAPRCILKPDFVFFDEMIPLPAQAGAEALVTGADLVLVAGTSCEVWPAAGIPEQVRRNGGRVIELNLEPAPGLNADVTLKGLFSQTAVALYEGWLGSDG